MPLNKKLIDKAQVYLILDANVLSHEVLLEVLKVAVRAGVDIVQLRDKHSRVPSILSFCHKALKITKHQIPFIVNDRADLSLVSGADGLHLGQDDLGCAQVRSLIGKAKIVGVSCQNLDQALKAEAQGADYIGFGSVFQTKTKPERQPMDLNLLKEVIRRVKIPIFPIGGINQENIKQLIPLGIKRVAVCRDILLAKEPGLVIKRLKNLLNG